jgi:3-(3-hydroxy-phenyl)propionate hydroxylase
VITADVAIVGYGPVGQAMAAYLGKAGISVAVFERDHYVYELARTGGVDDEAMRLFQHIGLAERILQETFVPGDFDCLTVDGELLLSWPSGEWGSSGYARLNMWHQPDIDRIVREHIDAMPTVSVHLEHSVEEVEQTDDLVRLTAVDRGTGETVTCEAKYVIGCDGGRSAIRAAIGGEFESLGPSEPWIVVDLTLNRDEIELPERPHHICDPARPVTFIVNKDTRRRWEFMVLPGEDPAEMARPENVWKLLSPWLKPGDAEIYRCVAYTFHALLAERWRNGRLLIAGDAAHLMPPFFGQGLCSGLRDVRNLSWKLDAVLSGRAPDSLLDTYGTERAAHVRTFIEISVYMGGIIQTLDPEVAARRDAQMLAGDTEILRLPVPRLGPGLLPESAEAPLGTLFPQPILQDGRLLDVVSGERFTILGLPELIATFDDDAHAAFARDDVAVIADASPETRAALDEVGATGVLIRPDRYLLATARSAAELVAAAELIPWAGSQHEAVVS